MRQNILTSARQQQMYQVRLFSPGNNLDELLIICNTSASQEFDQFDISITGTIKAEEMFSLAPHDASHVGKFSHKRNVRIDTVNQMNEIGYQYPRQSLVQRSIIAIVMSNTCKHACINIKLAKELTVWKIVYAARPTLNLHHRQLKVGPDRQRWSIIQVVVGSVKWWLHARFRYQQQDQENK